MSQYLQNGKWTHSTGGYKLKRFFCIQLIILIAAIITGVFARKLIPDYNIVCENVKTIPFNSLLIESEISMKNIFQDAQEYIDELRNDAIEDNYNFTVATILPEKIRLVSHGNILFSCQIDSVLEGNEDLNGQHINVFFPYSSSFYYQPDSHMKDFIDCIPPDILANQKSLVDAARDVPCFYFFYKNIPLPEHKYLAFIKNCRLSDSSKEYFFFMDFYDLTSSNSIPVVEGRLGQYKDYSDNEVFFSSQDDIDLYNSLKRDIISLYLDQ